jgi:hypothetical protein
MASHLRSLALAALGADHLAAAIMEYMNGSRVELTPPRRHIAARPEGARRSRILAGTEERTA